MEKYYKVVAENRKAYHDYAILEVYKAGIVLEGSEVKSLRLGNANLRDCYARVDKGELWILNLHISPYSTANKSLIDPLRKRKCLLQKRELLKLVGKAAEKGLTIIPLKVYFDGNWAKIDLGLAKSKKKYEKRETIRARETKREIASAFKGKVLGSKNEKVYRG
jgi:SsrA-binding protein